ncbi:MAG: LysR family transcriptional regulator [Gammaproteobacteria bacterium]|nr:LysR family transcriptional regulator [Gammaproteobacteria bacterium]
MLSFTKAADALHMTQPAVTFQVRQLEEYFNTRLFDRTHNRISLTEAGERVYRYAGQIFQLYEEMESSVKNLTGDISGVLMLGASMSVAEYMLPSLLGDFKKQFPEVNIRLKVTNTDGIVSMIEDNEIDLAVVEAPVANKNLVVEPCRADQLVVVTHPKHALITQDKVNAPQLMEYPYICREEGSGTREVIHDYLKSSGLSADNLKVIMELGSPEAIKGAIEVDMGISVLSRSAVEKEIKLGTLAAIPLEPPLERPFSFVHQKQKFKVQAMEELLNFARNYCSTHQKP